MVLLKPAEPERMPHVRWLIRRDMQEVMDIENRSFEFPWTEDEFLAQLRNRHCIGAVYESPSDLIHGFMIYELHADCFRLLNLAVAPEVRRTGVGQTMIQRLIDKLSQQRRRFIDVEVRETNLPAQLFLSQAGFRAQGTLRRHYDETDEDAILFRCSVLKEHCRVWNNRISQYFE